MLDVNFFDQLQIGLAILGYGVAAQDDIELACLGSAGDGDLPVAELETGGTRTFDATVGDL